MTSIYEKEYNKSISVQYIFQSMILDNIEVGLDENLALIEFAKENKEEMSKSLLSTFQTIDKKFCELEIYKNTFLSIYVAFETYLYRSLKYILTKHPSILSNRQFKVKEFLDSKKVVDSELFIERVITKELHDLFYKDFNDVFDTVEKKYSIKHGITRKLIKRINNTKIVRNLFLHSGGIVNHIFLAKNSHYNYKVGHKIEITREMLDKLQDPLGECVKIFDSNFAKKIPELVLL